MSDTCFSCGRVLWRSFGRGWRRCLNADCSSHLPERQPVEPPLTLTDAVNALTNAVSLLKETRDVVVSVDANALMVVLNALKEKTK